MSQSSPPSPDLFFDTLTAYQRTGALKAAIDLEIFTIIAEAPINAFGIAARCQADARGVRILCDYLTVLGFLQKSGDNYTLTRDTAFFLDRKSPAYAGGAAEFLLSDTLTGAFQQLTKSVRKGGTAQSAEGSTEPEHPMWLAFAHAMGGMMRGAAHGLAQLLPLPAGQPGRILDISASHGVWGIALAQANPSAQLIALDWAPVLKVTTENATAAGLTDRFSTLAGSAFDVDLGTDYDVVLVPNFLHHFNNADCIRFLKRAHAALRPGGKVVIVEFIPNPDRVTPPMAAGFSLVMLATTPEGDAYTAHEYTAMLTEAGFQPPTQHVLPASTNQALIAVK
jgi:2-polyprenyl-3-methyl-5-hydroxy-6-metoxy-1,4-benzoquinol methylase